MHGLARGGLVEPDDLERLYRRMLIDLWNAADADVPRIASEIAADDMLIHQRGQPRRGRQQLVELVRQGRAPFEDVRVELIDGPLIHGDRVAARWQFSARYRGGIPGATAPAGRNVAFTGVDWIRVAQGLIAEYWVYSDAKYLMEQLGA
jgi:predicted ester cyclase